MRERRGKNNLPEEISRVKNEGQATVIRYFAFLPLITFSLILFSGTGSGGKKGFNLEQT
jgi:hypothetical protein